jgi:prepilin-type N-terminal cleavage/methylation domain-containing protein
MPRSQRGFTLIEQVAVIAAVAAASVTAMPSLLSVRDDAQAATLASLAGALNSAMLLNQGGCLVTDHVVVAGKCQALADCAQAGELLHGGLPAGYGVAPGALGQSSPVACTLTQLASGHSAVFSGVAADAAASR